MNCAVNETDTVGTLVKERPDRSRVFESLHIDYCCGGKLPLAQACAQRGLNPRLVIQQIEAADLADTTRDGSLIDADGMSLSALADHIEQTHHAYLRAQLPRLDQMISKVVSVHGDKDPRLAQVRQAFTALRDELTSHMMKEEQILFPMVRQMEQADAPVSFPCGSIANPIRQMELEHGHAGDALAILRQSTDAYAPPPWACNTYRAMLDGLEKLEQDLHQHIHKENNVLFPKAIGREAELAQ
jgi:regulator of cell morphogenesis and NO signaling